MLYIEEAVYMSTSGIKEAISSVSRTGGSYLLRINGPTPCSFYKGHPKALGIPDSFDEEKMYSKNDPLITDRLSLSDIARIAQYEGAKCLNARKPLLQDIAKYLSNKTLKRVSPVTLWKKDMPIHEHEAKYRLLFENRPTRLMHDKNRIEYCDALEVALDEKIFQEYVLKLALGTRLSEEVHGVLSAIGWLGCAIYIDNLPVSTPEQARQWMLLKVLNDVDTFTPEEGH